MENKKDLNKLTIDAKSHLAEFLKLKNVTTIETVDDINKYIFNTNNLFEFIDNENCYFNKNINQNSIVLFDSVDINSAFLHEWVMNYINKLLTSNKINDLDNFNIFYIKSTDEIKDLIKKVHNKFDIPVANYPDKKYEIMIWLLLFDEVKDGENNFSFLWKSDDFDVINENILKVGIDLVAGIE